jgi:hypothetical protein
MVSERSTVLLMASASGWRLVDQHFACESVGGAEEGDVDRAEIIDGASLLFCPSAVGGSWRMASRVSGAWYRPAGAAGSGGGPRSRLRPIRGLKRLRSARIISTGHAFIQNLYRSHCELSLDVDPRHRIPQAFTELAYAS